MRHEELMHIEWLDAVRGVCPREDAVRTQNPGLRFVREVRSHHLLEDLGPDRVVLDRNHAFDPAIEVPVHPVG